MALNLTYNFVRYSYPFFFSQIMIFPHVSHIFPYLPGIFPGFLQAFPHGNRGAVRGRGRVGPGAAAEVGGGVPLGF